MFASARRAHYLFSAALFGLLGFHVGVWAVQLAPLSAGALESFLSSYLQRTLAGGVLLSGIGIGSYHFASLLGRLTATAALHRSGERRVVTAAGLLAAVGLLTAVMAPDAAGAIGGLLLVGFAIAPVVPTTLSLAGRSAPGRSGQAVATTTPKHGGIRSARFLALSTRGKPWKAHASLRSLGYRRLSDDSASGHAAPRPLARCARAWLPPPRAPP